MSEVRVFQWENFHKYFVFVSAADYVRQYTIIVVSWFCFSPLAFLMLLIFVYLYWNETLVPYTSEVSLCSHGVVLSRHLV